MRAVLLAASCGTVVLLGGCGTQLIQTTDSHLGTSMPRTNAPAVAMPAAIPPMASQVALPPQPRAAATEAKYNIVVVNARVQDVLLAVAKEAGVNIDIHGGIEGSVTLNAIDQPLGQILKRIASQVDMRYEMNGPNISVMPDTPYLKSYRVDYVNMTRDVTGSYGVSTTVLSGTVTNTSSASGAASSTSGASGANNSTVTITNTSKNRFWETLERNVKDLLRETDKLLPEGSSETIVQNRGQSASASTQGRIQARRNAATGQGAATLGTPGETQTQQASEFFEQKLTFREAASVIINPEAGVVTVRASSRQQEKVAEFLEQISLSARRQVLIEATVVEILLNDQYQSGVDWSAIAKDGLGWTFTQSLLGANMTLPPFFSASYSNPNPASGGNISSTIKLLATYGNTRVLSSPKLMVLNNQTAVLKVVDNRIYFTVQANTSQNANTSLTTFTTTQNVVPIGLIMNVTPQVSANGTVVVNVRPTVTRIIGFIKDPNPSLAFANVVSLVPETQTREMESMLRVTSGQTAVLGGLMTDSFEGSRDGLPIMARVPVIGDLFSNRNDKAQKAELVIFLRPIVIKEASVESDLSAYRQYLPDKEFFRDMQLPFPEVQKAIDEISQIGYPKGSVPEPPPPGNAQ
jgi:general secretion pathway protein D